MPALLPETAPSDVGLDQARLDSIGRHFDRYVEDRKLPGFLVVVTRKGQVAYVGRGGFRDLENETPVESDTRFRIYSMTKPVTSVAAMICYEEGLIALDDPLSKFIPEFGETRVFAGGSSVQPITVPMSEPIKIWHLMTHTAGLTYGWMFNHPVDAMYRSAGFEWEQPPGLDLADCCRRLAQLPLRCQPGTEWNYSMATDVLGRVVEVATGLALDEFFAERVFKPLGMKETSFYVEGEAAEKLAVLYMPDLFSGRATRAAQAGEAALTRPSACLGGSGLVSTAADYHRFTQMLLRRGELDGVRILGARTVAYMTRNHLPGGADMARFSNAIGAEHEPGLGFGLGFSVVTDPAAPKVTCSAGGYGWGGAASTEFWVDPAEELTVLFFTQLLPSSTYPIRRELHQLVYSAIIDQEALHPDPRR
jgi:CubicO group peptidase (beta-lactamase class C family)